MATYFEAWSCANKRASLALDSGDRELMVREQESSDCLYLGPGWFDNGVVPYPEGCFTVVNGAG